MFGVSSLLLLFLLQSSSIPSFGDHDDDHVDSCGDYIYTLGDDEFCLVHTATFEENCTTFNSSYNIAQTNGLAINADTGNIYIVASIGSKSGDRALMRLDIDTFELTTIATYTSSNEKLSAIAFTCSTSSFDAELYGITGNQADHSLYSINIETGELTKVGDLDASSLGNALAYSPYEDALYRVSGTDVIDIESIDYKTIEPNVTIESDEYLDFTYINKVSALAWVESTYMFLIDDTEYLYLFNTLDGTELYNITQLNENRQHKGIICENWVEICAELTETTEEPGTTDEPGTSEAGTVSGGEDGEDDAANSVRGFYALIMLVFVSLNFVL